MRDVRQQPLSRFKINICVLDITLLWRKLSFEFCGGGVSILECVRRDINLGAIIGDQGGEVVRIVTVECCAK